MTAGQPLLVVNADDYGLTEGVSRAILDAVGAGVVTSTSIIALGGGFASSARWLADTPSVGVGAHLAAVGEDPPLLSASEIPTLVDRRGKLWLSWRQFLPRAAARRIDPDDLRREFTAQMEAITGTGLVVDHLDTHQNLHLWPSVRDVVMDVGDAAGVRVVRVTRSTARGPVGVVVRRLASDLERRANAAGWQYPTASTGLDEAGGLDTASMVAAIGSLKAQLPGGVGSAELATHPGRLTDAERAHYRWEYAWEQELEALCSPQVRAAVDLHGFILGTFADLAAAGPG